MGRLRKNYGGASEFLIRMVQVDSRKILYNEFSFLKTIFSGSIELKEMVRIMTCLLELEGVGKV